MSNIREAGEKLRVVREHTYGWRMSDVERETREKFGEDEGMKSPQIHRIERGKLTRPPSVEDLAKLAYVYRMSPTEIFEIYGLPVYRRDDAPTVDSRIVRLENLAARMTEGDPVRERMLDFANFAARQAEVELSQRKEEEDAG